MTGRWKEAALLIAFSMAAVAFFEKAARWWLPPPYRTPTRSNLSLLGHRPDPEIGWILPDPGSRRHRQVGEDGGVHFDVGYTIQNGERASGCQSAGRPHLIVTGCSFTFGHGLNDADTWPWLLQERLPGYCVHNVACMGYGTDQALLAAERKARHFGPQSRVVALGFGDFQVERNRAAQAWLRAVYPYSKPLFGLNGERLRNRGLVRFWSVGRFFERSWMVTHLANMTADLWYGVPSHDQVREITIRLITTSARRFQSGGIGFFVVVLPYPQDYTEQARTDRRLVVDRLKAADIPILAAELPRLRDGRLDARRFGIDVEDAHPNIAYTTAVADQVASFVRAGAPEAAGSH